MGHERRQNLAPAMREKQVTGQVGLGAGGDSQKHTVKDDTVVLNIVS